MPSRHSETTPARTSGPHQAYESRPESTGSHRWLWLPALILLVACSMLWLNLKGYFRHREVDLQHDAILAAEHFLQERFDPGVKLRYPSQEWVRSSKSEDEYTVTGWLEAMTADGIASGTYEYTCVVGRNPDGQWYLTDLTLSPQ